MQSNQIRGHAMEGTQFETGFTLPAATHKQDDRAFIFCKKSEETGKDEWQYALSKPQGVKSEMVIDADEAFDIAHKRNVIIGVLEE